MASKTIKQALKDANKVIRKKIDEALMDEVFDGIVEESIEAISKVVYSSYEPKKYGRRKKDDGLGDPENMVVKGGAPVNGKITIINVAEPNPEAPDGATVDKNLAELVEFGNGYSGNYYDYPKGKWAKPRPFMKQTKEVLSNSSRHVKDLKQGLRRRNLKVED